MAGKKLPELVSCLFSNQCFKFGGILEDWSDSHFIDRTVMVLKRLKLQSLVLFNSS